MAEVGTLTAQFSIGGNYICKIYTLTNVQTSGSTVATGLRHLDFLVATNQTDLDEQMSAIAGTAGSVTVVAGTNDDDGQLLVLGRSQS